MCPCFFFNPNLTRLCLTMMVVDYILYLILCLKYFVVYLGPDIVYTT